MTGKYTSGYISENVFAFDAKALQITPDVVSPPCYFSRFEVIGNLNVQGDVVKIFSMGGQGNADVII